MAYIPNTNSGVVSGGGAPNAGYGNLPTQGAQGVGALPAWAQQNIAAGSTAGNRGMAGGMGTDLGMQHYNNLYNQYGQGQQNWTPWAFQNASAGGAGDMFNTQSTNLLYGPQQDLMAGHQYSFGANPGQMQSQGIMHNAFTGENTGFGGDSQSSFNPYINSYLSGVVQASQLGSRNYDDLWSKHNLVDKSKYGGMESNYLNAMTAQDQSTVGASQNAYMAQMNGMQHSGPGSQFDVNNFQDPNNNMFGYRGKNYVGVNL